MTAPRRKGRGKGRGGRGLLPPNPRQWEPEHRGLDLRDELGIGYEDRISVGRAFAGLPNVSVSAMSDVPMAKRFTEHLLGRGSQEWSGAAIPMPDGKVWVVYNDGHPKTRIRATLMEEYFHLRLGHAPSIIRVHIDGGSRRSFDEAVEEEAYASGAAALAPYRALRSGLDRGETVASMARSLDVSPALLEFRLKVTRLWSRRIRVSKKAG